MNTNKKKTNKKLLYTLAVVFFAMPSLRAMQDFGNCPTSNPVELFMSLCALHSLQQNSLINPQPVLAPQTTQPQQNNLNNVQPAPTNPLQQNNVSFAFNGLTNIVFNQVPLSTISQPEFSRFSTTNTLQAYNTQNSQPQKNSEKSHFLKCDYSKIWPDQPIISNQIIDIPKKRIFSQFSTTEPTGVIENPQYKIRRLNVQQNGAIGSQLFRVPSNQNTKEIIDLTEENSSTQQSALESTPLEKEEFEKASSNFILYIGASYRYSILKPYFTSDTERPEYIIKLLTLCKKPAMAMKFLSNTKFDPEYSLFDYAATHRSIDFLEKIINYIAGRVKRSQSQSCMTKNIYKPFIELIEKGAVLATKKNRTDVATFLNEKANELKKKAPSANYLTQTYDTRSVLIPQKTGYKSVPDAIKRWVLSKPTSPLIFCDPLNTGNTLSASKTIEELIKTAFQLGHLTAFEFAIVKGTVETLTLLLKMVKDLLVSPDLTNRLSYYSMVIDALNKSMFSVQDEARRKVLSDTILQLKIASGVLTQSESIEK